MAHTAFVIGFVVLIIAFKPFDMAVAFESKDMRTEAIKEPAVVGDDDGAAREAFDGFFECGEGFGVQIVGRFVEQDDIGF